MSSYPHGSFASSLGMAHRIYVTGQKNGAEILALMGAYDIIVLNSTYEGLPCSAGGHELMLARRRHSRLRNSGGGARFEELRTNRANG